MIFDATVRFKFYFPLGCFFRMSNILPFPIVDAHLHVWRKDLLNYDWLAVRPKINRSFVLTDYNQACGDVKVEKMVFIQAEVAPEEALREAEWVTLLAEQDPRLQAIVAWAPLELGDGARSSLEKMAANPRIKGVRRIIQFEPDQNFCLQPAFVHGVQLLSEYHFSFDICINHTQLANTIRLVQQCPDTSFVLDHIGKPDIKNSARAKLIAEAVALHKIHSAPIRAIIANAARTLEKDTARALRNPAELSRLLAIVEAGRTFDRLMSGGLKSYLVLTGVREGLSQGKTLPPRLRPKP